MRSQTKLFMLLMLTLAIFMIGCGQQTEKANQMEKEGAAILEEANKIYNEGLAKHKELFAPDNVMGFPQNREKLKAQAQEEVDLLTKSSARFRDAARKFEEASKLRLSDNFKQYLSLKAQEARKQAEASDGWKEMAQTLLDESVKDTDTYVLKLADIRARIEKLSKELADLNAQAEKVRAANQEKK